jgi:hypothetical protein
VPSPFFWFDFFNIGDSVLTWLQLTRPRGSPLVPGYGSASASVGLSGP